MFEGSIPHAGDPIFYLYIKFGEDILIGGGDMSLKLNAKQRSLAAEFYFRFLFLHVFLRHLYLCQDTKFQPNDRHRPVIASNALFTNPSSPSYVLCGKHPKWRNRTSDRESDGRF